MGCILKKIGETTPNTAEAAEKLETILSKKSGLLGVSELSNDMRDLREAIKDGNSRARLAVDKFTWTIARWIGSYTLRSSAALDMLVFTRAASAKTISPPALKSVPASARSASWSIRSVNNVRGEAAVISAANSPVTVRVIPPAEDLMIVNHVVRLLEA